MAAQETVPQTSPSRKSPINKHGVLAISGFGLRVFVRNGHLEIEDGVGLERRNFKLPRVGHGLKRLAIIGNDGLISLAALQWLADQDASFTFLDRRGKILFISGPTSPSHARLRRAQALAVQNGVALEIARELIGAKLSGQETVARENLKDSGVADVIARCRERLGSAEELDIVRSLEAQAAAAYWSAWKSVPVLYPKRDMKRLPQHWRTFGTRNSPLTGSSRLAVNPPNAILNYCYALLEGESRLASAALGLDPGIGMLHLDTPARDSLACDLMEPMRPAVDAWLLDWLTREPLLRRWFIETETGHCRLTSEFAKKLSETGPTWGRLVAPYAERIASLLWQRRSNPNSEGATPTRLTQRNKREARGAPSFPPVKPAPGPQRLCRGCGTRIGATSNLCAACSTIPAKKRLILVAQKGRTVAHTPEARARVATKQRQNAIARYSWKPADQPEWLTGELYTRKILPRLAHIRPAVIASRIGVSRLYAGQIRRGRKPHQRHWSALAGLVGADKT